MLPFKKGAFNIAVQAQLLIIPVVFSYYKPFYSKNLKYFKNNGKVVVQILKSIETTGVNFLQIIGNSSKNPYLI